MQHAATRHVHAKTKRPDSVSKCMAISLRTAIIWHIQSTQSNFPGVFATGSCDSFFENQTIKKNNNKKQTKTHNKKKKKKEKIKVVITKKLRAVNVKQHRVNSDELIHN